MKKAGSLITLLLAAIMLISCGTSNSQGSSSQPEASVSSVELDPIGREEDGNSVEPQEEPEQPWVENAGNIPIPDFLDEEQTLLYQKASWAYPEMGIMSTGFGAKTGDETIDIDGLTYYKVDGVFANWDDFYRTMTDIFTVEYFEELNEANPGISFYIEVDGDLYCLMGDRGGNILYSPPDTFELVSQTDDELVFYRIGHYLPEEVLEDGGNNYPETWEGVDGVEEAKLQMRFVKTKDGWRVAEFNIPY